MPDILLPDSAGGDHTHIGAYVAQVAAPTGVAATDTATLLAAIAAIPAAGGQLVLAAGTYLVSSILDLPTDRPWKLTGAGMKTTRIKQADSANLAAVVRYNGAAPAGGVYIADNFDYLLISDLEVHGNKANNATAAAGISIIGGDYVTVRDVSVRDCRTFGLRIDTCDEVLLSGVYATANGTTASTDGGIYCTSGSHDVSVIGCMVEANIGAGIFFNGTFESSITGCNGWQNSLYGIRLGANCDDVIVSGNVLESDGSHGILLESGCSENVLIANRCLTPVVSGIRLNSCTFTQVIGNICDAGTGSAIHEVTTADNNFLFGNQAASITKVGASTIAYNNRGVAAVSVTGSKTAGAALTDLLTKLATLGIIVDATVA